jgi:hypothetical protein
MADVLLPGLAKAVSACIYACTITLQPGQYGALTLNNLDPIMGATVVLTGSTFTSVTITNDKNLTIVGGVVSGAGNAAGDCWYLDYDENITLRTNTAIDCPNAGFSLNRSSKMTLEYWTATGMGCDAVDLAGVDTASVIDGHETASNAVGSCHPDGIQGWTYGAYVLSNITVSGNSIISGNFLRPDGQSRGQQGIDFWNNNGTDGASLPVYDIIITGNFVESYGGACVAVVDIVGYNISNNTCLNKKPEPWSAQYNLTGGTGTFESNTLDGVLAVATPVS